jgi:hypothetical protein
MATVISVSHQHYKEILYFKQILLSPFMVMVFNATFNNISVISWQSVLLVEEKGEPRENHWPVASHWQTLSHNVVSSTPCLSGVRTLIGTDCTGSCKSNYHTIMTTTAPYQHYKEILYFKQISLSTFKI